MKKRILVVDDTKDILLNLMELLSMEGFEVLTASNGIDAMACLEGIVPDLIITDWVMPGMDGPAFITAVRKEKRMDAVPILIFSAKPSEEQGVKLDDLGANQFVLKPSSTEVLLDAIIRLIKP